MLQLKIKKAQFGRFGEQLARRKRAAHWDFVVSQRAALLAFAVLALTGFSAHAESVSPASPSSTPSEIKSQLAVQPRESVLPCKTDVPCEERKCYG